MYHNIYIIYKEYHTCLNVFLMIIVFINSIYFLWYVKNIQCFLPLECLVLSDVSFNVLINIFEKCFTLDIHKLILIKMFSLIHLCLAFNRF